MFSPKITMTCLMGDSVAGSAAEAGTGVVPAINSAERAQARILRMKPPANAESSDRAVLASEYERWLNAGLPA
jgi:hypothetical protein